MSQTNSQTSLPGLTVFEADSVLFKQEDAAERLFVVHSGHVRLVRRVFREELTVETVGPGSLIGEVAVAAGATYTSTAVANEQVQVMVVPRDELESLLNQNRELGSRLLRKLAARIAHAHYRIGVFALRDFAGRVMLQLRAEAVRAGTLGSGAFTSIPFDLAEALGAERGQTDAALRALSDDALVELDGAGRFVIPDVAAFDRRLAYAELNDRFGK